VSDEIPPTLPRVRELFEQIVELPCAEQADALRELRATAGEIAKLEELLRADQAEGRLLDRSIAECMEHIAAAEDFIRGLDENNVMKAPAAPDRDTAKIDAGVLEHVPDRSVKAQAPEPIKPTNRYGSPEASIKHFVESRATTEEFVKTTPDLRGHAIDGPGGQKLDAYEWVLLIAAHSERHTKQIEEVKANPDYPKK